MTKNLALKAFSILLALVLAYAVNSESNAGVITVVVPLEFHGLPIDRVVTRPTKKSVQVTLKGPSFMIGSVASSPPSIRVKVPNQPDERFPVSFKASDMHLPPGVDVLAFDPTETELVLESLESKEVRVEVPRLGQLRSGLTLDGIQISPKTVIVRGPRTEVRQLKSVETEPVDLRDLEGSEKVELRLRSAGNQATLSTEKVSALIEVSQIPLERVFKGRAVELRAAAGLGNLRVEPSEVSVVVAAPADIVSGIESSQVIPYVRLREKPTSGPGDIVELQVEVETPSGSKVVRVEPNRVAVRGELQKAPPIKSKAKGK